MIKTEILFNGNAELRLYPETEDDSKALDLLLNGKTVVNITKPVRDSESRECCAITFSSEKK